MDRKILEERMSSLPIYQYEFIDASEIPFEPRVRQICALECPMHGKTWSCPPAVGSVEACKTRCLEYGNAIMITTIAEVCDIADLDATLATRHEHEDITRSVCEMIRGLGSECYALSSEACSFCDECAYPNAPCKRPDMMIPCIESHGILVTELAERFGIEFLSSATVVTWFSLIFYRDKAKGIHYEQTI